MLNILIVKNFALIESLEIEFSKGFSIITGETGAGKSILLDALGLLQGKRADLGFLKNNKLTGVIEGHFSIKDYALEELFNELGLEYEDCTIIRREILPSGKSRAFVNDSIVKLTDLQVLSNKLMHIHSQHETNDIIEEEIQLNLLDVIADNKENVSTYRYKLKAYKDIVNQVEILKKREIELIKESDYVTFLLNELEEIDLLSIDQELLEQRLEQLNNVELIQENFNSASAILNEDQVGIITNIGLMKSLMQRLSFVSKNYEEILSRVISVQIELKDISDTIDTLISEVAIEPKEVEQIKGQLELIYALQRKHQVNTVEDLIQIKEHLSAKTFEMSTVAEEIIEKEKERDMLLSEIKALSEVINAKRKGIVPGFVKELKVILGQVGMVNADFKFNFIPSDSLLPYGGDHLELLLAANKGLPFGLLKKVASGGELSRIMLAINAVIVKYSKLPTLIFDEIDTGVSGEVADKMGEIMKRISSSIQVFSITHLPQVAAQGDVHYKVIKESDEITTTSTLVKLIKEDRIKEIAQMLSGENITESALKHAKELLKVK